MESIKTILLDSVKDMSFEEKVVYLTAIDTIFAPIDPDFNPTVAEVQQIEQGCNGEEYFANGENEFFN